MTWKLFSPRQTLKNHDCRPLRPRAEALGQRILLNQDMHWPCWVFSGS
jgi:hypothetical protein